jgi:hypothetical protein
VQQPLVAGGYIRREALSGYSRAGAGRLSSGTPNQNCCVVCNQRWHSWGMPGVLTNKLLQSTVETRIWQVDGGAHTVSVRNYTGGSSLEVYLDAELVHTASTAKKRMRRKVALPDGRSGLVEVTFHPSLSYSFSLDGEEIPGDTDGVWDPASERRPDLDQCVSVPVARLGTASDGEEMVGVALYKVCLTPRATDDFAARAEWKRYNDFDELYTLAYSAYFYHQLASNVPKPPGKTMRRRTDDEFLETRRAALEHFLQQLLRVPRMGHNPDVLLFLGILDGRCHRLGKTLEEATRPKRLLAELDGAGGELPAEVQALLELCCEDSPNRPPAEAVQQLQQVSAQGGASLTPWLANTLEGSLPSGVEASKHVVVKVLNLLNALLPKGSPEFQTAVKERCALLLKQAESYAEAGVADPLVQGLAQKTSALLLGV